MRAQKCAFYFLFQFAAIGAAISTSSGRSNETVEHRSASYEHAKRQFVQMMADRLQMNVCPTPSGPKYMSESDEVCRWVLECFSGGGNGLRVFWDARAPDNNRDGDHTIGYGGGVSAVRVRDQSEHFPPPQAFERMWSSLVYEMLSVKRAPSVTAIYDKASSGGIDRSEFIRAIANLEYAGLIELKDFWEKNWRPWAESCKFPTESAVWKRTHDLEFDEWFNKQSELNGRTGYLDSLGKVYEWLRQSPIKRDQ